MKLDVRRLIGHDHGGVVVYDLIFKEESIMQERLGYLGPVGSFSGEAASLYGKKTYSMEPYPHLIGLMEAYLEGEIEKAILPIENSIEGAVTLTLDLLQEKRVEIIDEVVIPIRQNLLLLPGSTRESLRRILSHPQAIAQSRHFINELSPSPTIAYTASTAEAAKRVKEEGFEDQGAIASLMAADYYQLKVAAKGIEDNHDNKTRFVVLGEEKEKEKEKEIRERTTDMKTSIIVSPYVNRPGILYEILKSFAQYGIDLTRIESRPTKKALGEYIFYIDFLGSQKESRVEKALAGVRESSSSFKVLGSYPIWVD